MTQCFRESEGRGKKIEFLVLLIAYLWILCTVCTSPHQWWSLWILAMLSVVHLSPTALSHTQRHCRHAQLGGRLLQGCIRLHKLYSIFLQPASLYASTIASYRICFNCSHSCEIPCIPMFYGCLLLQSLPISLFASLAFWYPSLHLCIFSKFFFPLWLIELSALPTCDLEVGEMIMHFCS